MFCISGSVRERWRWCAMVPFGSNVLLLCSVVCHAPPAYAIGAFHPVQLHSTPRSVVSKEQHFIHPPST